jgi:hypothetical protein
VTDDLRVRSAPGVGDDSRKLEPLAQQGLRAIVIDGPLEADGYAWYLISPYIDTDDLDFPVPPGGWVASASRDGEPWLTEEDVCGDSSGPAIWPSGEMAPPAGPMDLACYGGREVEFSAYVGVDDNGACFERQTSRRWAVEPAWFDECRRSPWFLAQQVEPESLRMQPVLAPDAELGLNEVYERLLRDGVWESKRFPEFGGRLAVGGTGRYDHPAAQTCRAVPAPEAPDAFDAPDPAVVVYGCRTTFVVTSIGLRGP